MAHKREGHVLLTKQLWATVCGWACQYSTYHPVLTWPPSLFRFLGDAIYSWGVFVASLVKVVAMAMWSDVPWETTSSCSWIYDIKAMLVQRPIFMMAVASNPLRKRAMTPPVCREWEPTNFGAYPGVTSWLNGSAARMAWTMSLLVTCWSWLLCSL